MPLWGILVDHELQLIIYAGFLKKLQNITDNVVKQIELILTGDTSEHVDYEIVQLEPTNRAGFNVSAISEAIARQNLQKLHQFYLTAMTGYDEDGDYLDRTQLKNNLETNSVSLRKKQ